MMKNYLLTLLQRSCEESFSQDSIEWAITSGFVTLSYDLERDLAAIEARRADIAEGYQRVCRDNEAALIDSYIQSGVLEEILRPVPLSMQPERSAA